MFIHIELFRSIQLVCRVTLASRHFQAALYFMSFAHTATNTRCSRHPNAEQRQPSLNEFLNNLWKQLFFSTLGQIMQYYNTQSHIWSLKAIRIHYVLHLRLFLRWTFDFWIVGHEFVPGFHGSTTEDTNTHSSAKCFLNSFQGNSDSV